MIKSQIKCLAPAISCILFMTGCVAVGDTGTDNPNDRRGEAVVALPTGDIEDDKPKSNESDCHDAGGTYSSTSSTAWNCDYPAIYNDYK